MVKVGPAVQDNDWQSAADFAIIQRSPFRREITFVRRSLIGRRIRAHIAYVKRIAIATRKAELCRAALNKLPCPILSALLDEMKDDIQGWQRVVQLSQHNGKFTTMMNRVNHSLCQ